MKYEFTKIANNVYLKAESNAKCDDVTTTFDTHAIDYRL